MSRLAADQAPGLESEATSFSTSEYVYLSLLIWLESIIVTG